MFTIFNFFLLFLVILAGEMNIYKFKKQKLNSIYIFKMYLNKIKL